MSLIPPGRRCVLGGLAALGVGPAALAAPRPTVALLGDSITAGYGLAARDALPAALERELARLGSPARLRALGVSGDATSGGLGRLARAMTSSADLWIIALGGNDLLRGVNPAETRNNLDRMVARLKTSGARVMLAGIRAPSFLGGGYATAFNAAFSDVARGRGVALIPDMLAGVAGVRALNQPDGIHPNPAGVAVIARRMAPQIAQALAAG